MGKREQNARYRAEHKAEFKKLWNAWRARNREYVNLRAKVNRRIRIGADVPADDLLRLARMRENLSGQPRKKSEEAGTAAQRDTAKRVKVWEGRSIPKPKYEGETWIRMRMDDGEFLRWKK